MENVKEKQNITSARTSINTLNRVYKEMSEIYDTSKYEDTCLILDYGCGKYDTNENFAREHGFGWIGIDPYNRSEFDNNIAYKLLEFNKPDITVCSNVLNVIENENVINNILSELYNLSTDRTDIYITIYEGNKSGIGKETSKGYQRNQKVDAYKDLISEFFEVVGKKGNVLKCRKVVM